MQCWIYRGARRDETYLYVADKDDFTTVPGGLLRELGELQLVMDLELHPGRALARANAEDIMVQLRERGYYLQLPPATVPPDAVLQ